MCRPADRNNTSLQLNYTSFSPEIYISSHKKHFIHYNIYLVLALMGFHRYGMCYNNQLSTLKSITVNLLIITNQMFGMYQCNTSKLWVFILLL